MNFIVLLIFGALVGWVASIIMRTNKSQGIIMDIILGVLGALLGGFLVNLLGGPGVSGFNLYSFVVALIGAIVLIWVGQRLTV